MKITEWLEAQHKLLDAATPGPWLSTYIGFGDWDIGPAEMPAFSMNIAHSEDETGKHNVSFIASVRTEHERALKIIEKMREALEKIAPEPGVEVAGAGVIRCHEKWASQALAYFPEDGEK